MTNECEINSSTMTQGSATSVFRGTTNAGYMTQGSSMTVFLLIGIPPLPKKKDHKRRHQPRAEGVPTTLSYKKAGRELLKAQKEAKKQQIQSHFAR